MLGLGDVAARGDSINEMGNCLPIVRIGTNRVAYDISAGWGTFVRTDIGWKAFGVNSDGQLLIGDAGHRGDSAGEMGDNLPFVNFGTGRTASQVFMGMSGHACAILDDETTKCFGYGSDYELFNASTDSIGDQTSEVGDNLPRTNFGPSRKALHFGMGQFHTCALLDDGILRCAGNNWNGESGVAANNQITDTSAELGVNLLGTNLGVPLF